MSDIKILLAVSLLLFFGISGWLITLYFFAEKWKAIVDWEYNFHKRKGMVPSKLIEWQRRFCLGKHLKITLWLMWFCVFACLLSLLAERA